MDKLITADQVEKFVENGFEKNHPDHQDFMDAYSIKAGTMYQIIAGILNNDRLAHDYKIQIERF